MSTPSGSGKKKGKDQKAPAQGKAKKKGPAKQKPQPPKQKQATGTPAAPGSIPTPCIAFQQGKCSYGALCKFRHDGPSSANASTSGTGHRHTGPPAGPAFRNRRPKPPNTHTANSSSTPVGNNAGWEVPQEIASQSTGRSRNKDFELSVDRKVRKLTSMMSNTTTFSATEAEYFLALANQVLDSDSTDYKQNLIQELATEVGLRRIVDFVEATYQTDSNNANTMSFWHHCVPFLKIISHEELCSTLVLETLVGTIYNIIYGHSSSRAVPFLRSVVHNLTTTKIDIRQSPGFGDALCAVSRALWMTLKVNQSAYIQKGFSEIAQGLRQCFQAGEMGYSGRLADMELRKVEQKLNIGEAIALIQPPSRPKQQTSLSHQAIVDYPGDLSRHGPRHDNDKASIVNIRVLPTRAEVLSTTRTEYLPFRDYHARAHHLPPGIQRVLDTQFRLLREDTSGQLRDAIRYLIESSAKVSAGDPNKQVRHASGAQTVIYRNTMFENLNINEREGLQLTVSFDQPAQLTNKNPDAAERRRWWTQSRFMQTGSLTCLVDQHKQFTFFTISERIVTAEGNQNNGDQGLDMVRDLSSHPTRALTILKFVDLRQDLERIIAEYHRHARYYDGYALPYLVEFPAMLLASFSPILKFLQDIVGIAGGAVPFSRLIAPEGNKGKAHPVEDPENKGVIKVPPPAYMSQGVSLDLSVIMARPVPGGLKHSIMQPCSVPILEQFTTLDKGQCEALLGALTRELALIQGPPGTGKSYVGVQIVKVLLHNHLKLKLGPIICVCYTNHALDQFLVDLLNHGVKRIIRIGSRSQAPELEQHSLRNAAQGVGSTFVERQAVRNRKSEIQRAQGQIRNTCFRLRRVHHWTALRNHLEEKYPVIHQQLFPAEDEPDEEGFVTVNNHGPENIIHDWVHLRYLPQIPGLDGHGRIQQAQKTKAELMMCRDMSVLTRAERRQLKEHWEDEMKTALLTDLKQAMARFEASKLGLERSYLEKDRRCLHQAQVVGVTTSGLAGHAELLRNVRAKVLICEEAGEVLEAHSLAAFLPSVQHAILIGDHQQLRPHIADFNLSMESRQGEKYSLDESLFERLIRQTYGADGNLKFPFSTLDTQRRMHPSISDLVRQTLYDKLKDHPTVTTHLEVEGMARRLFWMNHTELEHNPRNTDPTVTSKSNQFEVEMVTALVTHLIKQGCYGKGDIAVITPYLGQLMKLRRKLENIFEIVLGEKDQEEVELAGIAEDKRTIAAEPEKTTAKVGNEPDRRKDQLQNQLRLATVDNFQGEEAKVIVVSLVRCNPARRCGFLKTSNRINVLLSRARHGMYIIGNADTARPVQMWSEVLTLLARDGNIGEALELRCPRHQGKQIIVQKPEDFLLYAPEGGCEVACGKRLDNCSHICPDKCHSAALHQAVICQKRCQRKLPGCDHPCRTICGKRCEPCIVNIPQVLLPCEHFCYNVPCHEAQFPDTILCLTVVVKRVPGCGHELKVPCYLDVTDPDYTCIEPCELLLKCNHKASNVPCHEAQTPESLVCSKRVSKRIPTCGHKMSLACHVDVANSDFRCSSICKKSLECGHECTAYCWECQSASLSTGNQHVNCRNPCGRSLGPCEHSCPKPCHAGVECAPCDHPCEWECSHYKCPKKCTEPCTPCGEPCRSFCIHRGRCKMPCAVPCDILPCDKRCALPLRCGHQCPSLCGEPCPGPEFCQQCANPNVRLRVVNRITPRVITYQNTDLDASPVIFPRCGHFLTVQTMDRLMRMRSVYEYEGDSIIGLRPQQEWTRDINRTQTHCSECQCTVIGVNRYNRITKGTRMTALTSRLVREATQEFLILEKQVTDMVKNLENSRVRFSEVVNAALTAGAAVVGEIAIDPLQPLIAQRHQHSHQLARRIEAFAAATDQKEQPHFVIYSRVRDSIHHNRVTPGSPFAVDEWSVNPRSRLLGRLLHLKLEWAQILDTFKVAQFDVLKNHARDIRRLAQSIRILLPKLLAACQQLEKDTLVAFQPGHGVEAKLLHARFVAMELALPPWSLHLIGHETFATIANTENLRYSTIKRTQEKQSLLAALVVCRKYPRTTIGLVALVEQALQILSKESNLSQPVMTMEWAMLYATNSKQGWTQGDQWNFCVNRHLFSMAESDKLGLTGQCAQCEAPAVWQDQLESPMVAGGASEVGAGLDFEFGRLGI